MGDFARSFAFTFIPIFVALDTIGVLPISMGLAGRLAASERKQVIRQDDTLTSGMKELLSS